MEVEYMHTFIAESSLGGGVASTCVIIDLYVRANISQDEGTNATNQACAIKTLYML